MNLAHVVREKNISNAVEGKNPTYNFLKQKLFLSKKLSKLFGEFLKFYYLISTISSVVIINVLHVIFVSTYEIKDLVYLTPVKLGWGLWSKGNRRKPSLANSRSSIRDVAMRFFSFAVPFFSAYLATKFPFDRLSKMHHNNFLLN